jgi:hypothetical protein
MSVEQNRWKEKQKKLQNCEQQSLKRVVRNLVQDDDANNNNNNNINNNKK